jgi:hypothetical protein
MTIKEFSSGIKIEITNESIVTNHPASIKVFKDNQIVTEILAKITLGPGLDGNQYPYVDLSLK